jgi:hypothetical protein
MADTGWVICGTGASDSTVGTEAWANPGNITADDANYANGDAAAKNEQMEYIKGSNFGLSVPTGATIDGIEIRGQFYDNNIGAFAFINYAQVYHPTSGFGDDQEAGTQAVTTSPANYDYGGATELHGLSWSASDVNNSGFAVLFSLNAGSGNGNPRCDAIWVKVYYTEAADESMEADVGSFTLTGNSTTPDVVSPAGVGSFALSGQVTTSQVVLPVDVGAFTFTGQNAGELRKLPVGVGAFTLTGQVIAESRGLPVGSGAFALTGISISGAISSSVDPGSFALTGYALIAKVTAGTGIFNLTGQVLSAGTSTPVDVGAFALTGQATAEARAFIVDLAAFTLTGVSTSAGISSPVEVGAFTLTGIAVAGEISVTVDPGNFALTGVAVSGAISSPVSVGGFTLTGQAVASAADYEVVASVGMFSLTGVAALADISSSVGVGGFTLSGRATSAGLASPVSPGSFALSGQPIIVGRATPVSAGVLGLTGLDVSSLITNPLGVGAFALTGNEITTGSQVEAVGAGLYTLTGFGIASGLAVGEGTLVSADAVSSTACSLGSRRILPDAVVRELNRQDSAELLLVFLTITHPQLADPIRVVSDPRSFVLDNNTFTGFLFDIQLLSDTESAPYAELSVQNVDKVISEGLLLIDTPARLHIEVISGSQFNLDDSPCTEIGGAGNAARVYSAPQLFLTEVDCNALQISGRIVSWDYTQEPWPGVFATKDRLPGLFR